MALLAIPDRLDTEHAGPDWPYDCMGQSQSMIRVAALTQGQLTPSARLRVRQNIPELQKLGINVSEYFPEIDAYKGVPLNLGQWPRLTRFPVVAAWQGLKLASRLPHIYQSRKHDITWLQREFLPGYVTLERILGRPLVLDVDDAIWLAKNGAAARRVSQIASYATAVIAGNQYIADWCSSFNDNVVIIPTAVDAARFVPGRNISDHDFTIGWIGTKSNISYLEKLSFALSAFFKKFDNAVLFVISDGPPQIPAIPESRIRFMPWSERFEAESLSKMDVGIMPLPDNEWTKGKCSFKMLQYMACGIPVVVSPVGMNKDILSLGNVGFGASSEDEWVSALEFLYLNRAKGREMGICGRNIVIEKFSTELISEKINEVFRSIG